ncbi:hypothetical protein A2911_02430 [Candidatus Nomurabacteria bacterium RIFCSPLOWO2_01_FULL_40_15]|uniref:Uncharacterized protein n=1 Tax=Candidatus Nomurabacteria bacterium RIFCSPLOWO2_01_FULL_40_15 TaxID=1801772 RepID=A0A1F6X5T7_9BACT|nr:MAG: hypothetical protein A2911_02430 [Candidatus Nomurabacteria bacterium RIFCSPLOWO2_01_FULL_40_15]
MLSNILDRVSFWSLFSVIVLLPVFFLPFTKIPIETSKGLLLVVGLTVSIISWMAARLSEGQITIPKSFSLVAGLGIVLSFFLSATLSGASEVSFFGIMFNVGTFWFIFACFLLMFMSSVVLRDSKNTKIVLFGTIASFIIVLIFQGLRFLMPETLSLGILGIKTDNILGSWNALGLFAGFSSIISLFLIELFLVSKTIKWVLGAVIGFSLVLIATVNFSLIWALLGIFALIIFIFKISLFSGFQQSKEGNTHFPIFSLVVVMVSLLFFISGQFIGGFLPNRLGLSNIEASPSFQSTMLVTKEVLSKNPIFGIGPNRFGEAWAMYKPASINNSPFLNVYFESSVGVLPTFASTTGGFGILMWLLFFFFFIRAGLRSIFYNSDNQTNLELMMFFLATLFLYVSSFFYSTGVVIFLLAFAFAGMFIGINSNRPGGQISISFVNNPRKIFFFVFVVVFIMILTAATGFKYIERLASVSYFGKALSASTVPDAESSIQRAISLFPNDLYLRTYAQIYLIKFNSIASTETSLSEVEKANLQTSLDQAINGAVLATNYNKKNYLNFETLGYVYSTVGSLGVSGSFEEAIKAYSTASTLNPLNPGLKLSIARTFFADGKMKEAKDYANQSLSLRPNFVDALFTLSQIIKKEGDNATALFYAKKALSFSPESKELVEYVNSFKNTSSSSSTDNPPQEEKKKNAN